MNAFLLIVIYSYIAGVPIIVGESGAAFIEHRGKRKDSTLNRWIVAFGGGSWP